MIVITGAGGFIGSVILGYLNKKNINDIMIVDDLPSPIQFYNISNKKFRSLRSVQDKKINARDIDCVIHFGAISSTLETNWMALYQNNVLSTRTWHDFCLENQIKFIFASSAAIYGNGTGPRNQYAFSKQVSEQEIQSAVILRLFNVYGPNEYHKGRMASTPYHWYNQLHSDKEITIFENSKQYFRDFIWVEDVASTVYHFINNYQTGTYDLGTGSSTDFNSIADMCLQVLPGNKKYISLPDDLKYQYQTNTCADTASLKSLGVDIDSFVQPSEGIKEYFEYLKANEYL